MITIEDVGIGGFKEMLVANDASRVCSFNRWEAQRLHFDKNVIEGVEAQSQRLHSISNSIRGCTIDAVGKDD